MNNIKARYRNKLKKIIIEVWDGEKWLYVKTLLDPLIEFKAECLAKVSLKQGKNEQKDTQTFAQSSLSEPQKKDIVDKLMPPEQAIKKLMEINK